MKVPEVFRRTIKGCISRSQALLKGMTSGWSKYVNKYGPYFSKRSMNRWMPAGAVLLFLSPQ